MTEYTNCRIKFLDDESELDVIIKSTHSVEDDDDEIFFYGMSKKRCIKAMETKEICENEWQIIEVY